MISYLIASTRSGMDEYVIYALILIVFIALVQTVYYNFIEPFTNFNYSKPKLMQIIKNYIIIALFILALMGLLSYLMLRGL